MKYNTISIHTVSAAMSNSKDTKTRAMSLDMIAGSLIFEGEYGALKFTKAYSREMEGLRQEAEDLLLKFDRFSEKLQEDELFNAITYQKEQLVHMENRMNDESISKRRKLNTPTYIEEAKVEIKRLLEIRNNKRK